MITQVPPGFVKMGNRLVPAQTNFGVQKQKVKKFLVCIQHFDGDRDAAEQLASLIADLERTRNRDADIMLMRRADSRELSAQIVQKLQSKFDKVIMQVCRRIDARSYPFAPNQMWSDLLMLMAQNAPYALDYYAFINMETDVVPTRPGWIGELIAGIKTAVSEGKSAIGFFENDPIPHMNGVAVYAADIYRRAGGNVLAGGSPQVAYDIRHARTLLPMAKESPLFHFKYRQPSTTPDELFAVRKDGIAPAIYHGVKDGSARAAVRARHITFTSPRLIVHQPDPAPKLAASEPSDPTNFNQAAYDALPEVIAARKACADDMRNALLKLSGVDIPSLGVTASVSMGQSLGVMASIRAEENALKPGDVLLDSPLGTQQLACGSRVPVENPVTIRVADNAAPSGTIQTSGLATPAKRPNVYTYSHKHDGVTKPEMNAILAAWTKGWTSRGWNPVVLTLRDAAKHTKFEQFQAAVEKLPCVGDKKRMAHRFYRWLALDVAGGGLMTDWDVLPNVAPNELMDRPYAVCANWAEHYGEKDELLALWLNKEESAKWIDALMGYDAQPDDVLNEKPHVSDKAIIRRLFHATENAVTSIDQLTHFQPTGNERKSVAMERFLAGK